MSWTAVGPGTLSTAVSTYLVTGNLDDALKLVGATLAVAAPKTIAYTGYNMAWSRAQWGRYQEKNGRRRAGNETLTRSIVREAAWRSASFAGNVATFAVALGDVEQGFKIAAVRSLFRAATNVGASRVWAYIGWGVSAVPEAAVAPAGIMRSRITPPSLGLR